MQQELQASFYALDEQAIRAIADRYGVSYYLSHSTPEYVLYRVDSGR